MKAKDWSVAVVAAALFTLVQPVVARDMADELDIYFVPTPEPVVDAMLRLADVREGDTVYDLGCGDGRIVITAASRYGVPAVGIDLDPARIAESVANAEAAGVAGRVRFIEGNLFDADLRAASVVTLYLLTSINERLRPKLLRELKPGSRVVSHSFAMGPWRPDRQTLADGAKVFLWVVPAQVDGRWQAEMQGADGPVPFSFALQQAYQEVTGLAVIDGDHMTVEQAQLDGERLDFVLPGTAGRLRLRADVGDGAMTGWVYADGEEQPSGRWSAVRVPSAGGQITRWQTPPLAAAARE